jgi:hypothetical protein
MTAYTSNTPNSGDIIANTQPLILANFQYLQTSGSVDHNFTANTSTAKDGYHKVIHFVDQGSTNPGAISGVGQLFTKTVSGDQQLFYESGGGVIGQISGPYSLAANGFTILQGGVLLNWGIKTVATSGTRTTVSFNRNYSATPYSIQITSIDSSGSSSPSENAVFVVSGSVTTSQFIVSNSSSGSVVQIYWQAIGPL